MSKLDIMKEFARAKGLDPERILVEKVFAEPMASMNPRQRGPADMERLSKAGHAAFQARGQPASSRIIS